MLGDALCFWQSPILDGEWPFGHVLDWARTKGLLAGLLVSCSILWFEGFGFYYSGRLMGHLIWDGLIAYLSILKKFRGVAVFDVVELKKAV